MLSKGEPSAWYQAGGSVNGTALKCKHCCDTLSLVPYGSTLTGLHYGLNIPFVHFQGISWGETTKPFQKKPRYSLEASLFQRLLFVGNIVKLQVWFLASCRVLFNSVEFCTSCHASRFATHTFRSMLLKYHSSGMCQSPHIIPGTGTWKEYRQKLRLPYNQWVATWGIRGHPLESLYLMHVASLF